MGRREGENFMIQVIEEDCDRCHNNALVMEYDNSGEEFSTGKICLPCITELFNTSGKFDPYA